MSRQSSRNVSLTPALSAVVDRLVRRGRYESASEVVREGLRLVKEREELHEAQLRLLQQKIAQGQRDADAGRVVDGPAFLRQLKTQIRSSKIRRTA